VLLALSAGSLIPAAPAVAAHTIRNATSTSSNWAGYVASATGVSFSDVKGTWVQPSVTCTTGATYSSFWVGLGGYATASQALEQIGTSADCSTRGRPTYYAWYELVPSPPVRVALTVAPGNTLTGEVAVNGTAVTLTLTDVTTGKTFTTTQTVAAPDISSAEWIAEAPSACDARSRCQVLPLANFGTVAFSTASAVANGAPGALTGTAWATDAIQLASRTGLSATPSAVGADGASFTVATSASAPVTPRFRWGRWGFGR